MPYIKPEQRSRIFEEWRAYNRGPEGIDPPVPAGALVVAANVETPGCLNYAITKLITWYLKHITGYNYKSYNEVIGVLECCKLELYRRMVAPYEDGKIEENGDVY